MMPTSGLPPVDEMKRAYLAGPGLQRTVFVGVRTTVIFCRPTCPRGRPCRRTSSTFRPPRRTLRLVSAVQAVPADVRGEPASGQWRFCPRSNATPRRRITEGDLRRRGVDPATVRRHFLRRYGMTFQAYARARRLSRAFRSIRAERRSTTRSSRAATNRTAGFAKRSCKPSAALPARAPEQPCVFWLGCRRRSVR